MTEFLPIKRPHTAWAGVAFAAFYNDFSFLGLDSIVWGF